MIESYATYLAGRDYSLMTIDARLKFFGRLLREWDTFDRTPEELAAFLGQWEGWSRRTYTYHLRSIYAFLVADGHLDRDPTVGLRLPPTPHPRPTPLPLPTLALAKAAATPRRLTYLLLGELAGLRRFEIASFGGENIDAESIRVVGKGRKLATIPTHPALWELAQTYPRTGYWFPAPGRPGEHVRPATVGSEVRVLFRAVGIESGGIHRTRHTFGTELRRRGVDLRVIQELLRHSSLATTAHYLGVDEDEKAAAVRLLAA